MVEDSKDSKGIPEGTHKESAARELAQAMFWSFAITQGEPQQTERMGQFAGLVGVGALLDRNILDEARSKFEEMTASRLEFNPEIGVKKTLRGLGGKLGVGGVAGRLAPPEQPRGHRTLWEIAHESSLRSGADRVTESEAFRLAVDQSWNLWMDGFNQARMLDADEKEKRLDIIVPILGDWIQKMDYHYLVEKIGRPGKNPGSVATETGDYSNVPDTDDPWLSYIARYLIEEKNLPGISGKLVEELRARKYLETRLDECGQSMSEDIRATRGGRGPRVFYGNVDAKGYISRLHKILGKYEETHSERFSRLMAESNSFSGSRDLVLRVREMAKQAG